MTAKEKSYRKYCQRIYNLEKSQKISFSTAETLLSYWNMKRSNVSVDQINLRDRLITEWERLATLRMCRAIRGCKVTDIPDCAEFIKGKEAVK